MAKFNTATIVPRTHTPVHTEAIASAVNHKGGPGHARDPRGEFYLLAVSNLVSEDTFYERGGNRDARFAALARELACTDFEWLAGFLPWLRTEGGMRHASLVAAAQAVHARLAAKLNAGNRDLVASVLRRPDEPGEMLAYWLSTFGRAIPMPVKKGVGAAALALYNEFATLKWDSPLHGLRFADVLNICHPKAAAPWQRALFTHLLDERFGRPKELPAELSKLAARAALMALPVDKRRSRLHPQALREAGMTWESLAGWLQSPMDRAAWEAIIPTMGIHALLRNLRNFDQAGVGDAVAEQVAARLFDAERVAKHMVLPFQYYAAHIALGSLRWGHALEKGLAASLGNVPELGGRTLVLVDQSPSMFPGWCYTGDKKSTINLADRAKLFGAAVALRAAKATLVGYGAQSYEVPFGKGDAVLEVMKRFRMDDGTDTLRAVAAHYKAHDRVLIVTDEQTQHNPRYRNIDEIVPAYVPVYTWNVAGYKHGHGQSGTGMRATFGGLTDKAFRAVPLIEAGRDARWPWEQAA